MFPFIWIWKICDWSTFIARFFDICTYVHFLSRQNSKNCFIWRLACCTVYKDIFLVRCFTQCFTPVYLFIIFLCNNIFHVFFDCAVIALYKALGCRGSWGSVYLRYLVRFADFSHRLAFKFSSIVWMENCRKTKQIKLLFQSLYHLFSFLWMQRIKPCEFAEVICNGIANFPSGLAIFPCCRVQFLCFIVATSLIESPSMSLEFSVVSQAFALS